PEDDRRLFFDMETNEMFLVKAGQDEELEQEDDKTNAYIKKILKAKKAGVQEKIDTELKKAMEKFNGFLDKLQPTTKKVTHPIKELRRLQTNWEKHASEFVYLPRQKLEQMKGDWEKVKGERLNAILESKLKGLNKLERSGKSAFKKKIKKRKGQKIGTMRTAYKNELESWKQNNEEWVERKGLKISVPSRFQDDNMSGSDRWNGSGEASFLRYTSGLTAGLNKKDENGKMSMGINGQARVDLFQGKAEFSLYYPDRDGLNIQEIIRLRLRVELKGEAMVSASVLLSAPSISAQVPEKGPSNKLKASAGVELNAFAGAQVEGSALISLDYADPVNENNKLKKEVPEKDFTKVADVEMSGQAAVGIGVSLAAKISYQDGMFICKLKAFLCLKIGAGGSYAISIPVENAVSLLQVVIKNGRRRFIDLLEPDAHSSFCQIIAYRILTLEPISVCLEKAAGFFTSIENYMETRAGQDKAAEEAAENIDILIKEIEKKNLGDHAPESYALLCQTLLAAKYMHEQEEEAIIKLLSYVSQKGPSFFRWVIRGIGAPPGSELKKQIGEEHMKKEHRYKEEALKRGDKRLMGFLDWDDEDDYERLKKKNGVPFY
ncbi:MAG: hypothetical protein HQK83_18525, partial [Fibrobacteria bacterium]|nr:hypothetical protein [Fibrobacteria bacterium]